MRRSLKLVGVALLALIFGSGLPAQTFLLDATDGLQPHNAELQSTRFGGRQAVKMTITDAAAKEVEERRAAARASGQGPSEENRVDVLAFLEGVEFSDGVIELELVGEPAPGAVGGARGFVGLAFRVQPDSKTYDAFYLRPTNGHADDQERRNHTVQYIHHPEFPWYRLRQETPSRYEAWADIAPGEWIAVRIEVEGDKARLFVNGAEQPSLIVNDVKSGADGKGRVALWIEGSTVAHFRNVRITPAGS